MIVHVDMDAFYASVEERDNPELVGKPIIVGGSPTGRGVVAAANYEVRKYGVHSAMPTSRALRLCPHAVVIPPRMGVYSDVSRDIHEIFGTYTPLIEPLALDEAFLDVSRSEKLFGSAVEIARTIKGRIARELQLVASVGVAPTKFVAKLASDLEKPDGFVVVDGDVQAFLDPLPIERVWGVGKVTAKKFAAIKVATIADLRALPLENLEQSFGKFGSHFWNLARGIDKRAVVTDHEAGSISHETTFPVDIEDMEQLRCVLMQLTEQVGRRVRRSGLRGRTVQLKVRYNDFHTITRSRTVKEPTDSTDLIWEIASELLTTKLPDRRLSVRLLGVGLAKLHEREEQEEEAPKSSRLDSVTDQIKDRFGSSAVKRALNAKKRE